MAMDGGNGMQMAHTHTVHGSTSTENGTTLTQTATWKQAGFILEAHGIT